ncbi:hypothetical protein BJV78DRAFT_1352812 [Lactifluus subvellereus]|nr:hypothetical protein BJV78DRAFT_1352812 [Lactifluus subvellereus]
MAMDWYIRMVMWNGTLPVDPALKYSLESFYSSLVEDSEYKAIEDQQIKRDFRNHADIIAEHTRAEATEDDVPKTLPPEEKKDLRHALAPRVFYLCRSVRARTVPSTFTYNARAVRRTSDHSIWYESTHVSGSSRKTSTGGEEKYGMGVEAAMPIAFVSFVQLVPVELGLPGRWGDEGCVENRRGSGELFLCLHAIEESPTGVDGACKAEYTNSHWGWLRYWLSLR